jgi:hypothetical protein
MIYFANFLSVTKYGIIFWSNSTDSKIVFQLRKKIVRITTETKSSISYKPVCRAIGTLTLPSEYILSSMNF